MRRRLPELWALGFAALLSACGSPSDEEATSQAKPTTMEQALDGASCRPTVPPEAQPNAPTGVDMYCSGPWEYREECFKLSNTSACPEDGYHDKACQVDKTCDYTIRGPSTYSDRRSKGEDETRTDCDYSKKPPCVTQSSSIYLETCQLRATQLIAELKTQKLPGTQIPLEDPDFPLYVVSAVPAGNRLLGSSHTTQSSGSGWSSTITATPWTEACSITIGNVVKQGLYGQHPECGKQDALCPDYSRPKYAYCRAPAHGMENDPATCDSQGGQGLMYSPPDQSQYSLQNDINPQADIRQGSYPNRPRCLTAEDTAFSAVETKYTRLVTQLDAPVPQYVDGPALKFQLINALKLLFELHADDPAFDRTEQAGGFATRRERMMSLFGNYPEMNHFFRVDPAIDFAWGEGGPSTAMEPNTFSARWTGFVEAPQAGTYVFHLQADDGARVWVDGQSVLNQWGYSGPNWYTGSINLTVGRHALKVEYHEGVGAAGVHLKWQPPGVTAAVAIPANRLFTPDEQSNGLLGEYFDNHDLTSDACGTNLPELQASCPEAKDVQATLTLCQRMLDSHISDTAAGSFLQTCVSAASAISQLDASRCDIQAYRTAFRDINSQLLIRGLPRMTTTLGSAARVNELREKLAAIQQWYGMARAREASSAAPSPELMTFTSQVMQAFWKGAWLKDELGLVATTPEEAETVRARLLTDGFVADRQVLLAAFGEGGVPPLTGAPLLFLLDDSLRGLNERLLDVSRLHDMGCRFMACATRSTTTSQLWNVLANLHDPATFQARVSAAVNVPADWKRVFNQMASGHGALRSAVEDALGHEAGTYEADDLFTNPVTGPAMSLTSLLSESRARATGYAVNGLFTAQDDRTLKVGLDQQKQAAIVNELNRIIGELDTHITAYNGGRLTLVQGLLGQLQNQSGQASLDNKRLMLDERLTTLNKDLNALRVGQAVEEARLGDFMDGFQALYPAIAEQGQAMLKTEKFIEVKNRGRGGADDGIQDLAERDPEHLNDPFKLQPSVGSQLVFRVGGRWSPTCALGLTQGPNGTFVRVNTQPSGQTPIMTGPEGFSVVTSQDTYTAQANETVDSQGNFSNATNTDSFCGGFNLSIYGIGLGGMNSCMTSETGTTWSRTWNTSYSRGTNTHSTFSAARGLRSPMAPFPDEPVGGLLLVEMIRGATDRNSIRSVQVLQSPSTSVLVKAESDYYLVVNDADKAQCAQWLSDSRLQVQIAWLSPVTNEATSITTAMVSGLAKVKATGQQYAAQGRLLPSQINSLRTQAFSDFFQSCNCTSLEAYPESLRTLFSAFVEKALVDVEREVELVNLERQMREVALEINAVEDERAGAHAQSRLLSLTPAWALRNLDGSVLRLKLEALDEVMSQWLAPSVRILYPATLANFTTSELNLLNTLTQVDPTSPDTDIVALAQTAKQAAQAVETRLSATRIGSPASQVLDVIVSIPKPGTTPSTLYRKMDPAQAKAIWTEILANGSFALTITPEHVYSLSGGQKLLPCNQMTPVIRSMVLFGILPNNNSSDPYTIPLGLTRTMRFPAASSLYQYDFATPAYLGPSAQVLFGTMSDPVSPVAVRLDNYLGVSSVATGLSPFNSYHVNLQSFVDNYPPSTPGVINPNNPMAKINELLVAFRVETRQEAPNVKAPGVLRCQ
ncbi:hypothetical protein HJC10_13810 [Corallococcus exiguus]|uniref:PA14 domain-containing protein n=1 Tax=Corallococcus exiguus TaxID=83462 RepID=UPI001471DB85|nr:PA14 domain-containing protein [Corallococcus exiguus]NNB95307.1 hypothetical protein [Corallococcus exiguus]NNC03916.1 hypothetical protein [Corallococcus exiguus]